MATRRTKTDLESTVKYARFYPGAPDAGDTDRMRRLVDHGWLVSDGDDPISPAQVSTSGDGERIAGAVHYAKQNDAFDMGVDLIGVARFVDIATACVDAEDAASIMGHLLSLANLCDEARHGAGTQDVEPDHDGLFRPHIGDVDPKAKTVEVTFESEDTAAEYLNYFGDFRVAVQDPSDPTRVVVDVDAKGRTD